MPFSSSPAATSCSVREPTVDRSTRILIDLPYTNPCAPNATSLKIAGVGRLVKTTCALSATSRALPAICAPIADSSASACSSRS